MKIPFVAIVVGTGLLLSACGDDDTDMTSAPILTVDAGSLAPTSAVVASESTSPAPQIELVKEWIAKLAGRTVSYRMDLECVECGAGGSWRVVEQEGNVVEAEFLGDGTPYSDRPTRLLSEALRYALDADALAVSVLSPTSIRLTVDVELNAIDDEFVIEATDITLS